MPKTPTHEPIPYRVDCHDDAGQIVFSGTLEYADGGMFGVRVGAAAEDVTEWPAELTHVATACHAFLGGCGKGRAA